jgi:hypothetical protein
LPTISAAAATWTVWARPASTRSAVIFFMVFAR